MNTTSAWRRALLLTSAVAALAGLGMPAWAAWPDRPLKLVVPFPAGGTVDYVARQYATQLGRQIGGTVVVENVPGAGGSIATARVAKAAPDGYTLLFTTPNHTINPALLPSLPFDTVKDLQPVSLLAQIPELLVAHAGQPYNDFAGFVAYARSHPGQLNYSSAGNGTLPHITMELLLLRLGGLQVTHVPYKGAAPALNDLLAGQVGLKMDTIATATPHIKAGRIKPLAIASLKRSPLMPEVPTVAELGAPGYQGILWMGVLVPAGTDAAVVTQLQKASVQAMQQPELNRQLQADGVEVLATDSASFARLIDTEIAQWADVVKRSKIKAD
ncbi:MAG: tripartite tricarboxylate transporter substrate binding protein [Burkholderiaceae bacterium]|nr:tripartite tricarboxylate transporter substrate binding protein [Burkholderiaceae bacterium]